MTSTVFVIPRVKYLFRILSHKRVNIKINFEFEVKLNFAFSHNSFRMCTMTVRHPVLSMTPTRWRQATRYRSALTPVPVTLPGTASRRAPPRYSTDPGLSHKKSWRYGNYCFLILLKDKIYVMLKYVLIFIVSPRPGCVIIFYAFFKTL